MATSCGLKTRVSGRIDGREREKMTGADLTKLPSLDLLAVQRISSEIGLDLRCWHSAKHFCAWLNVAPNNLSGFSGLNLLV